MNDMSKYDREDPSRDRGARERALNWRDRVRDEPARPDERYGQAQRRDDYSASDYRYDYRSARYGAEDRDDDRRWGRFARDDRDDDNDSGYSGSPYYGAGYLGPYASGSRDPGRTQSERNPYGRGGYQPQAWSRDPRTDSAYGHDYEARWPSSGSGSDAYHRPVRWRSESELGSREGRSGYRGWSNSEGARNRDFASPGGNYGKGPKGYVRSDERIREDVCDRLSDDDELDASDITVNVSNGEVRLEGSVIDRQSKHRAEDLAESVSGVQDVTNNLRARKGLFREIGDKLSGEDRDEHRGHAGSGTHNSPSQSSPPQGSPLQNSTLGNSSKGGMSANR